MNTGFVTWHGGERPVSLNMLAELKFRDAPTKIWRVTSVPDWRHGVGHPRWDIVAYREIPFIMYEVIGGDV